MKQVNNGVVFQEHTCIECDDDGYGDGGDEDNDDDDATDKRTAVTTPVGLKWL